MEDTPRALCAALHDNDMVLSGIAMRYHTDRRYKLGAFTLPEPKVRRAAVEEAKRGLDVLAEIAGTLMTLWIGQDGFDYLFQMAYARGMDISQLQTDARASGMRAAIVDAKGEYGAVIISAANLNIDRAGLEVARDVKLVVLQNEIPEAINLAVAQRARAAGAQVWLNAAPRTGIWAGPVGPC